MALLAGSATVPGRQVLLVECFRCFRAAVLLRGGSSAAAATRHAKTLVDAGAVDGCVLVLDSLARHVG